VVHPRFGDTARVTTEASGRPQLVADIDTDDTFCVQVDDEPGSTELAAQFARNLATAALPSAQRYAELIPDPAVAAPPALVTASAPVALEGLTQRSSYTVGVFSQWPVEELYACCGDGF
jgi:hypothetical protein